MCAAGPKPDSYHRRILLRANDKKAAVLARDPRPPVLREIAARLIAIKLFCGPFEIDQDLDGAVRQQAFLGMIRKEPAVIPDALNEVAQRRSRHMAAIKHPDDLTAKPSRMVSCGFSLD